MIDYKKLVEEKHYLSRDGGKTWKRMTLYEIGRDIMTERYPRHKLKGQFWFEVSGCDSYECTASKRYMATDVAHTDFIDAVSLVNDDLGYYQTEDFSEPIEALHILIAQEFLNNNEWWDRVPRSWIGVWRSEYAKLYGKKKKEKANG